MPQFAGSVIVFTHAAPQSVPPAAHAHDELRHAVPDMHAIPHPPQFRGSVIVFVHAPAQRIPTAQEHIEVRQTSPPGHVVVQLPQ